jgi:hypothetical protein
MSASAELFDRAGRALYGDLYVASVAVLLGLDKALVLKMRNGKSHIYPPVWRKILAEADRREKTIGLLREALLTVIESAPEAEKPGNVLI